MLIFSDQALSYMNQAIQEIMLRLIQAIYREQLLPHHVESTTLVFALPQQSDALIISGCHYSTLGRLLYWESATLRNNQTSINHYQELLQVLERECRHQFPTAAWQRLLSELHNNQQNMEQCQKLHAVNITQTQDDDQLLDFVRRHHRHNSSLFFEQFAQSGHPYHPCHKTKLGFNPKEYQQYSAEFSPIVKLYLAAIETKAVHLENTTANTLRQFFQHHWPHQFDQWQKALANSNDYTPLLIHPWQAQQLNQLLPSQHIAQLFDHITIAAQPTLSFRTMDLNTAQGHLYCKLPVAIQATSAVRTVSPASVQNGPKISQVLQQILHNDPFQGLKLRLLRETFGVHFKHPETAIAKQLGMIMREHPNTVTNDHEMAIVVAALFEPTPTTQLPLFFELLSPHSHDPWAFITAYFAQAIDTFLSLFLLYGIALECHQQNTLLILKDHQPDGFIIRDFGGVRIHTEQFSEHNFQLQPHPESATFGDDRNDVRNKLIHCLYQVHLGEMIILLDRYLDIDPKSAWRLVRTLTERCITQLKPRLTAHRWQQDANAILNADWQVKSLLSMRLSNDYSSYTYASQANPMAQITSQE